MDVANSSFFTSLFECGEMFIFTDAVATVEVVDAPSDASADVDAPNRYKILRTLRFKTVLHNE